MRIAYSNYRDSGVWTVELSNDDEDQVEKFPIDPKKNDVSVCIIAKFKL